MEKKETLLQYWWKCKLVQPLWRTVWRFLKKQNIEIPYDSAIPLLDIYPEKTVVWKDMCTPVFTAALARKRKQPKCPSMEERTKIWCLYSMEYYSAIKRNEIMPLDTKWMDLGMSYWVKSVRHRNNLSVHRQKNGWRRCGIYTMGYLLSHKKEWNDAICNNMDRIPHAEIRSSFCMLH